MDAADLSLGTGPADFVPTPLSNKSTDHAGAGWLLPEKHLEQVPSILPDHWPGNPICQPDAAEAGKCLPAAAISGNAAAK